jgi:hypothetical protein
MTWKSLAFQPYFTNTAANAGYTWWSHDIGGHQFGEQDDELYIRWVQYGVFSPINRLHSSCSDFLGKEPWKRSYAAKTIAEEFLRLRHRMIPMLYSANYRTHTEGIPVCMPMYYAYDCEDAYNTKNQYLFCESLLVCPVTEKANPRLNLAKSDVWLPEGRWTDFFTSQIYQGGKWVTMHRDLDTIPVLAPAGAILPLYRTGDDNDLSLTRCMDIHVFRGNGSYTLYEDDGETFANLAGHFLTTRMEVQEDRDCLCFRLHAPQGDRALIPEYRDWRILFRDVVSADILVNGETAQSLSEEYVYVAVNGARETVIELRNIRILHNQPREQLRADLLTRVQGSNVWKGAAFPTAQNPERAAKLPRDIRQALEELDALEY